MKISFKKSLLILLAILVLASFLRLWNLKETSFVADEYIGLDVGYGYKQSGEWKRWDFNKDELTDEEYERGKIYYWQVAKVFEYITPSERNARLVSVFWGLIGVVSVFLVSYLITKKPVIGLIAALLYATSITCLMHDRELRMYSMFAPIFLWFSFVVYLFLEASTKKCWCKGISNKIGVNLCYLPLVAVLGYISYKVHLLSVTISCAIVVYVITMAILTIKKGHWTNNRYVHLLGLAVLAFLVSYPTRAFERAGKFVGPWVNNWSYLEKTVLDYSVAVLALTFFVAGGYYLTKQNKKLGVWLLSCYLGILFSAIMFWERSAGHQYIYFVQPIKIIVVASGIYFLAKFLAKKLIPRYPQRAFVALVIYFFLILINFSFFFSKDSFYEKSTRWNRPNYRQAYDFYRKNQQPGDILIIRDLMRYNIWGTNNNTFSYGNDENKLTLQNITDLENQNNRVWLINSNNEFNIKKDAKHYIRENYNLIKTAHTNDKIEVWVSKPIIE